MKSPRVFVINEPLRRGDEGRLIDLAPAERFGPLVHVLPAGRPPSDHEGVVARIRDRLADFSPSDYLLPIGQPYAIGWAFAIAARNSGGRLRTLMWDGRVGAYSVAEVELFEERAEAR